MTRLSDFDFPFDPLLVADRPVEPRDEARLLVIPLAGGPCAHQRVADLPRLLRPGDLLIVNDTKVLPVRLQGRKATGGLVQVLLVRPLGDRRWEVLLQGRVNTGQVLEFDGGVTGTVQERSPECTILRLEGTASVADWLETVGQMPLPPYIKRAPVEQDRRWYQTVFAAADGAVAAPTAGLHFTSRLVTDLAHKGIHLASVTLHVGPATFKPVRVERIEDHRMGLEWGEVPDATVRAVHETRARGGRIVAVGTTAVRTLESAATEEGRLHPWRGETSLFIRPGYQFRVIDGLMTNFHLPRTTLLMLVSALAGLERLREAYQEAVKARYRFYSYGDGMLIL